MKRLILLICFLLSPALWAADDNLVAADEEIVRMSSQDAKAVLAQTLPSKTTKTAEIDYLIRRQQAAFVAGDSQARIDALRRLVELTSSEGKPSRYLGYLWNEEWRNGNQTTALAIGEKLISEPAHSASARAGYAAILGQHYLSLGKDANGLLDKAEKLKREAASSGPFKEVLFVSAQIASLRAAILRKDGNLAAANTAINEALDLANQEIVRARTISNLNDRNVLADRAQRVRDGILHLMIWQQIAEGKNIEAEATARTGLKNIQSEQRGGANMGDWLGRLAQAKLAQRRYSEASDLAQQAIVLLQKNPEGQSSHWLLNAQTVLMHAYFGLEQWQAADFLANQMRTAASSDDVARSQLDSPILRTILDLNNGRIEAALKTIDASVRYRLRNYGDKHVSTIEAKAVRAMVYQANNNQRMALNDYADVFKAIFSQETSFADAEPSGLRGTYLPLALHAYLQLVQQMYQANGNRLSDSDLLDDSFRIADRLRASVVQRALIDSAASLAASTPELAAMIRQERDQQSQMREEIRQITQQLEEDKVLDQTQKDKEKEPDKYTTADAKKDKELAKARTEAINASRKKIAELTRLRGQTLVEIAQRFPDYQSLVNPKPPTLTQIGKSLRKGEMLISIYPSKTGTLVWSVNAEGKKAFHFSPLTMSDIHTLVGQLRSTLDIGDSPNPAVERFDFAISHQLYRELIAPVFTRPTHSLTLALTGDLAQIPFATLTTQASNDLATAPWLIKDVAINQLATATAFYATRNAQHRPAAKAFIGFGDPLFQLPRSAPAVTPAKSTSKPNTVKTKPTQQAQIASMPARNVRALLRAQPAASEFDYGKIPKLPETREEILALANLFGADTTQDVFFGAAASRKNVMSSPILDYRIVAFATHGLKPGDIPKLSRPALALAASNTDSPLLTLDDVLTLKLNADWVILSACNTASNDGRAEEAFSGLARGFYFAGSRAVLATQWAVETQSAKALVVASVNYFSSQPNLGRAESLRLAQLDLIAGQSSADYRHPFFWAAYVTSGDPGR